MNNIKAIKTSSVYMGNDRFVITVDGKQVGIICHIKRENIRSFSQTMTAGRTWTIEGRAGSYFATKSDAIYLLTK